MARSFIALLAVAVQSVACGGHQGTSKTKMKKPMMQTPLTLGLTATISFEISKSDGRVLESMLSESLGEPVSVQVYASYSALVDALVAGMLDLAWMPPLAYVAAIRHFTLFSRH